MNVCLHIAIHALISLHIHTHTHTYYIYNVFRHPIDRYSDSLIEGALDDFCAGSAAAADHEQHRERRHQLLLREKA